MPPSKRVVLCADDFACDHSVSEAILELVDARRLSAVSCFTDSPLWPALGQTLRERSSDIYVGLHFNLTEPFGHGERPRANWIARAISATIDRRAVRAHLQRQFAEFRRVFGRSPDFVDGHEHVHAFPGIRSVVHGFVAELTECHPVRVRMLTPPFGGTDAALKRLVIQTLARLGRREGPAAAAFNRGFAGDYSLDPGADYERLFAGWLVGAPDGGLIMCHPRCGPGSGRPTAGQHEHAFLRSDRCKRLFSEAGVGLARPADRFPPRRRLTVERTSNE
jgi:chitin disaccharide deacetylase